MAAPKRKAPASHSISKPVDRPLFDDFLPHLIARLAYQLNIDLVEKLKKELA